MEAPAITTLSRSSFFVAIAALIAIAIGFIAYNLLSRVNTVPSNKHSGKEGFQGPTNGVSTIPCGQESADAIAILEMFSNKQSTTGEGSADLKEFKLILSKLCCFKHDLMSPGQVVQGMLRMPYSNTHDRENPADIAGRCFTKSVPPRDLDIIFATWKDRAVILLKRLCTSYKMSQGESKKAMNHFMTLWSDVFDIAKGGCVAKQEDPASSPRDPKGFTPETTEELGPYKGYY